MNEPSERRYSQEQLDLIVARAIALQDRSVGVESDHVTQQLQHPTRREGLTLRTIREIAVEVGIDPRFVEEAALSLKYEAPPSGLVSRLTGGPMRHEAGGTVQPPLTTSVRSELVDRLRRDTGQEGEVREVMDSVEWATVGRPIKTTVAIRNGEDATEVRVRVDGSGTAAFTWLGSVGFGVLASGTVATSIEPATTMGLVAMLGIGGGLGAGLARGVWLRVSRSIRERAERLRDELVRPLSR